VTATGNIIAVLLPLLGLSVKSVFDKIDAAQLETKKELQSQSRLITQILTSLAKMETNIAWMGETTVWPILSIANLTKEPWNPRGKKTVLQLTPSDMPAFIFFDFQIPLPKEVPFQIFFCVYPLFPVYSFKYISQL
jgi:hypothetical protein